MTTFYTLILNDADWRLAAMTSADGSIRWLNIAPSVPAESEVGSVDGAHEEQAESDAPAAHESASAPALEHRVAGVARTLRADGHGGEPILLALPAMWCLTASVTAAGVDRANRRRALGFQLEEHLPVAAEHIVADYVEHPDDHVLGVAVELARLQPTIDGLETAGIPVAHACPATLLAAAEVTRDAKRSGADDCALLRRTSDGWELLEMHADRPRAWWWFGKDRASLTERITAWAEQWMTDEQAAADHAPALYRLSEDDAVDDQDDPPLALPEQVKVIDAAEADGNATVVRQACRVLDGSVTPWIECRRDALAAPGRYQTYRRPMLALVSAVIALLVGVGVAAHWRAEAYRDLVAEHRAALTDHFRTALPDQPVPTVGVLQRMGSEYRKLAGVGGQASDEQTAGQLRRVSALRQLQVVLDALPDDLRYRLLDVSIQPDRVRLDGQVRQHADAERLAVALRRTERYDVDSPKTQSLRGDGVGFVFIARPRLGDLAANDAATRAGLTRRPPGSASAAATTEGVRP